jgi:purine nucleosidase
MVTKIILDCDPGHDDAVAMLLAWGSPAIDLVGVTTVMGNQTIEKVTRNALSVARIAGITGVPFAQGAHRPLVREAETASQASTDRCCRRLPSSSTPGTPSTSSSTP